MPLTLTIEGKEIYSRSTGEFLYPKTTTITLEHSLVSISKWESNWEVPYLSTRNKTPVQAIDYLRCMTLTKNVDPAIYLCLTEEQSKTIEKYIKKKHHANTFSTPKNNKKSREVTTAETIYFYMFANGISKECEKWHLNKLLALIEICSIKNSPGKKMSKKDLYSRHSAIQKANRARMYKK